MSNLASRPPPPVRRRRRGLRALLGFVVVFLAFAVAGYFLARQQIGEFCARKLGERLSQDGVFIGWKSAEWVPGIGTHLNGLAVYRDSAKRDRLALFGFVTVRRSDPSWLRWDKVTFNAANTQLLLGSGADETRLERMKLVLLLEPGRTDLREFHASLQGLRIQLTCSFVDPAPVGSAEAVAPSKNLAKSDGLFRDVNLDWLKPVKEWLNFQPEKDEPLMKVELHSLVDDKGMGLTMTFEGSRFQWRGQKWDFVQAAVKFPFGTENAHAPITVEHVRIGHGGRTAEISAAIDPASRVIHVSKFESGIDALALARALEPDAVRSLSAASTSGAWLISGAGEIPLDHPENFRWKGDAALDGELVYASAEANVALQKPAFSLVVQDQVATISTFKAGLWEGSLDVANMQIHLPSNERKLQFEGQLMLNGARAQAIVNSFSGKQKQPEILPLEWKGDWQFRGTAEVPLDQLENFRWKGDVALDGELVYASEGTNVALQKPKFSVRMDQELVSITNAKAGLWEGNLDVSKLQVHLPSKEKKLRLEGQLTLDGASSQSVIRSFGGNQKQPDVVPLNWKGAWQISGAGEIPVDQPENFRWKGDVALDGELVYASGETNVALQKPKFSVRMDQELVSITNAKASLWEGNLDVSKLQVHLPSKEKKLRLEAQLALDGARSQSVIRSFGGNRKQPDGAPLNWMGAWRISGAAEIPVDQPENFRWNGDVGLDGELIYVSGETNVALQKPTFSVRVEEQTVSLSDFKAGLWEGTLNAPRIEVRLPSKEKNLRLETQLTLNGARLQPIINSFSKAKQPGVVPLNWKGAWRISGAAEVPVDQPENFRWNGDVALDGDLVYASAQTNIALRKPTFSVRAEEQLVTISDFKAGLWEGSLNAPKMKILLPSNEKKVRFETQLTINGAQPQSVRKSFSAGQKQPRVVRLYWKGAWRISAAGEIPVDHPENFRWNSDVALGGDLGYASGQTNVALKQPTFSVRMEKQVVSISAFEAGLWDGSFNAPRTLIYLPSGKKKPRFETQFTINGARLQSIIDSFGGTQTEPGVVQFDWKGGGGFDPGSRVGSGALSIGEGEFGRMPIIGPLHLVFGILAPGFHKDEPSTMTVNYRVAKGFLFLDDLKLVSQQVRVEAGGTIDLAREYTQLHAKGRLRKLPGVITTLLSFVLQFKGEGPVDNVRWRLKAFPSLHLIGKASKKAIGTEEDKPADRALKGLIELPGKVISDK